MTEILTTAQMIYHYGTPAMESCCGCCGKPMLYCIAPPKDPYAFPMLCLTCDTTASDVDLAADDRRGWPVIDA